MSINNLKNIVLSVDDYTVHAFDNMTLEEKYIVTKFALYISQLMQELSYCTNKRCPCNSRSSIKILLKNKYVKKYLDYLGGYTGDEFDWDKILSCE